MTLSRSLDHLTSKLRFGREHDVLWHTRLFAARHVGGPLLRQIELAVEEGPAFGAGIGQEDTDLAVLAFASGARILAFDADRLGALLEKAGLINDEDGIVVTEVLDDIRAEVVADLIGIPVSRGKQALDAIGRGVADMFSDLPAILALDGTDESAEVVVSLLARFSAEKVMGDALMKSGKADGPSTNLGGIELILNHAFLPPFFTAWLLFYQVRL
jgi:hypothetical protein